MNEIRTINTAKGQRFVMTLAGTARIWEVYKFSKPGYLSVRKVGRDWLFSIWGASALEVRNNHSDLQERQRQVEPAPQQFERKRPIRPRHPEEDPGYLEDGYMDRGMDADNY